ncbi:MAG: late competence development ComFB family protein [Spirochaetaceae bacterium]|jgi:competence protein ComFB|nr:late competence development ComFB family protein [Spirochaetaceae bacterium]
MDVHNTSEDVVFKAIEEICGMIEKDDAAHKICTCYQCRLDIACFVLNRIAPYYIISNRGAARVEQEAIGRQQLEADVVSLIHEGIKRVNHNQRPYSSHTEYSATAFPPADRPVFNIPTIIGRLFNGINFEPMADIEIELYQEGELVNMKDKNWQNPFALVKHLNGVFTFWPEPVPAEKENMRRIFEYAIEINVPGMETLRHFFQIPVTSELKTIRSFSMTRTFKIQDLYMFPPGGDEDDEELVELNKARPSVG